MVFEGTLALTSTVNLFLSGPHRFSILAFVHLTHALPSIRIQSLHALRPPSNFLARLGNDFVERALGALTGGAGLMGFAD